jgi:chemotaxis protein MotB
MSGRSRGHAGRDRRRGASHEEEHAGGHERWLVTYADMLTLLLVLFIVLYAMSVVDTTKFVQLRTGLAAVFDPGSSAVANQSGSATSSDQGGSDSDESVTPDLIAPTAGTSSSILDQQVAVAMAQQAKTKAQQQDNDVQTEVDEFKEIQAAITTALAKQGLQGDAEFSIDERGLVVTLITDTLVFGGNSAVLLPGGLQLLSVVVPPLQKFTNAIEVDGHTNQQNVSTAPYPSGWELSSARASSVVEFMIKEEGISASRLSAVGFSDQKPLYPATDPRSITLNRRVDIVVLSNLPASERGLLPTIGAEPSQ